MLADCQKVNISAQIECSPGHCLPVGLAELSETNCRLGEVIPQLKAGMAVLLWLGAIGPLTGHVDAASPTVLVFDGPIHPAIVSHFNAA